MSAFSRFLITVMVVALLGMGAIRGYQLYERKAAQWEEERAAADNASITFQHVPVSLAAPQAEPVSRPVLYRDDAPTDIYLTDEPLDAKQEVAQASATIGSILADYKEDAQLQAFNRDLAQATQGQAVDLRALSGGNLKQVLDDNPQIREVVAKHMQDPAFAQTVQQVLSNPQFIESVRQLQKHQAQVTKQP